MNIKYMKPTDLIPYDKNAKQHDKTQINNVALSIEKYGFVQPVVVDANNVIVIGHCRVLAAKQLGCKEVPCVSVVDLTPEEINALRIVDNKSNESPWDFELLSLELPEIDLSDFDFDFGVVVEKDETEVQEDDFEAELPEEPKAKLGDIYQLGRHRLMCGDSTKEVDVLLAGAKIELLMTDPPYGINADKMTMGTGKKEFHRGDWDSFRPPIEEMIGLADKVCIWGGNYFTDVLPITNNWLCWWKKNDGLTFSEFELAWTNFGRNCRHIAHHWGSEKKLHVTMKPLEVIAWAINQSETSGNVADLFGGSGTTLIACEQLGRTCYMMELDPKYVDVIIERWERYTGEKAVLIR